VVQVLLTLPREGALRDLAERLIAPEPELEWRFFHLAVA
jgi:hypothetical protein